MLITTFPERPERTAWKPDRCRNGWQGFAAASLEAILMETWHIRAALSSITVKTDRNDARCMAHLPWMGWFRPVHLKSLDAREQRALLSARATLTRRRAISRTACAVCYGVLGFASPRVLRAQWARSVHDVLPGNPMLLAITDRLF